MFAQRLIELRGDKTQEEIAKLIGVSRASYAHYEQGRSEPNIETLQKLANVFEVSTDYLLGKSDDPIIRNENDQDIIAIQRGLKNLSSVKRKKALQILQLSFEEEFKDSD